MTQRHTPPSTQRCLRQPGGSERGVSLVEMLIGLTIGLLVSLAAMGVITFSRISSITVNDTVQLQQNANFIMRIIGQQLRQARSVALMTTQVDASVGAVGYSTYQGTIPPGGANEVAVFGTEGGAAPDTITISTGVLNGLTTDCLGFQPAAGDTIVSTLDINGNSLRCTTPANNAQPMVDNIEDFQVWYGVRNPVNGNIQYLTAAQVGAPNWASVGAVLVCLRMSGTTQNAPDVGAAFVGCRNEAVAWDGRVRRVFRQVFTLRNPA